MSEGASARLFPADRASCGVERRVFLGGLAPTISEADLVERLRPFGAVTAVQLSPDPLDPTRGNRGYAHLTLETSPEQWQKLVSAYNGSSWRGCRLRIEEARPDYTLRRTALQDTSESSPRRRCRPLVRHRGDMSLVTDAMVAGESPRRGWKRGRFGRAVAVVRMRRPDGRMITIDPDHHKQTIQKLFGSVRPLPITRLSWSTFVDDTAKGNHPTSKSDHDAGLPASESDDDDDDDDDGGHPAPHPDEDAGHPALCSADDAGSLEESSASGPANERCTRHSPDPPLRVSELATGSSTIFKEETGFSLGRLLGLAPVSVSPPPTKSRESSPPTVPTKHSLPPPPQPTTVNYGDFLYDMAQLQALSASEYAFCRRCGRDEYIALWKAQRSDLRKDFKRRIQQAKRLSRQRPSTRQA